MENIIEITDFSAPELDVYARLTEAQLLNRHKPEKGIFIAESPLVIERALNAGYVPISFLVEKKHIAGQAKKLLTRCKDIPVYTSEFDILTQLTGFQLTRGMLCAMYRPILPSVEEICSNARRIAVLENVVNPTNVGAIFRSAAALHMDAVLLTPMCSNPLYRRAIRVSMGTVFQIPWTFLSANKPVTMQTDIKSYTTPMSSLEFQTQNTLESIITKQHNLVSSNTDLISTSKTTLKSTTNIEQLQHLGFKTVAMALTDNSISIDDPRLRKGEKLAIILGTEGEGLSEDTITHCDYTVRIPMSHSVDSLNVAAASAVAFWELGKK